MSGDFRIELEESDTKGVFSLFVDQSTTNESKRLGEMTFSKAGSTLWIIDHTEVADELRGTGAGAALVKEGVRIARDRSLKILPLCPFAKGQFQRHPDFADVLSR